MKILVTVGTSSFDPLIKQIDQLLANHPQTDNWDFTCQIGNGDYQPTANHFRFEDNFLQYIEAADVVITHAGAGTVFELLDRGKKLLAVPNFYRLDKHQQDLARYIEQSNYGAVCWSLPDLADTLAQCINSTFKPYQKDAFFMVDDLLAYFGMGQS